MNITDEEKQVLDACKAHLLAPTARSARNPELLLLKRHSSGLTLEPLPVPGDLWEKHPPAVAIAMVADVIRTLGVTSTDAIAIGLGFEAFAVTPESSPQAAEAIRRHMAGGSMPPAGEIPGRVRQKCIAAVDRRKRHYHASVDRLDDGGLASTVTLGLAEPDETSGGIAAALDQFAEAALSGAPEDVGSTPPDHRL